MIRVLLVDDQKMVREALKISLEPEIDLEVVGTANDGITAIEQVKKLHPDVVVMNMEMPILDGASATQKITSKFTKTRGLILTSSDSDEYTTRSLAMGAKGYLLKNSGVKNIAASIRNVYQGYTQIAPGLLDKLLVYTDSGVILSKLHGTVYGRSLDTQGEGIVSNSRTQKTLSTIQATTRQQQAEITKLRHKFDRDRHELPKIKQSLASQTKYIWLVSLLWLTSFTFMTLISFVLFRLNHKTNSIQLSTIPQERVGLYGEFSLNGIAERVAKTFEKDPILSDISTIYVAQEDDAIILTGTISDPQLLKRMENIAKKVSGVNGVYSSQVAVDGEYRENLLGSE